MRNLNRVLEKAERLQHGTTSPPLPMSALDLANMAEAAFRRRPAQVLGGSHAAQLVTFLEASGAKAGSPEIAKLINDYHRGFTAFLDAQLVKR